MFDELISEVVGEYDGYTYEVSGSLEDYGSSDAKDDKSQKKRQQQKLKQKQNQRQKKNRKF